MHKMVYSGYPCDTCGLTSDDNESHHSNCDFCDFIGCSDCTEEHVFEMHNDELEGNPVEEIEEELNDQTYSRKEDYDE